MSVTWSPDLTTSIPILDEEHKELFKRIARLETAISKGKGKPEIKRIAAFLEEYAETHFQNEEKYMEAWDYSELEVHKTQHLMFRVSLEKIRERITREGPTQTLAVDVDHFLAQWLNDHVFVDDKRMGIWLGAILTLESGQAGDDAS